MGQTASEMGSMPIYWVKHGGHQLALRQAGVGVPFAAALLDEAIGSGAHKVLVCGGCDVLDREIAVGHLCPSAPCEARAPHSTIYWPAARSPPRPRPWLPSWRLGRGGRSVSAHYFVDHRCLLSGDACQSEPAPPRGLPVRGDGGRCPLCRSPILGRSLGKSCMRAMASAAWRGIRAGGSIAGRHVDAC